mgnify:CR=1 FL=1
MSSVDQLAALVPDGASLTLNKGDEPDVPMALGMALIRRGVRGLHVITLPTAAFPASGMLVDLLIGAGCVASVETSGISLHELGPAPRVQHIGQARDQQREDEPVGEQDDRFHCRRIRGSAQL